jgi:hypothetical protein
VPVTVIVPLAAEEALNMQDEVRTELLRDVGEQAVVMPEGEDGDKVTVPVNPLLGVSVIVEDPGLPALNVTEVGFAASPKSGVPAAVALTAIEAE